MSSSNTYESVADFYSGKSVFITGGTGFLGKVVIEKLLYSCPKLVKIYMLIREKKSQSPAKRLQDMFELPIFSRLKKERPDDLSKIIPIVGDITMFNLGIAEEDEKILLEKVNVVFHIAATVMFNLPLKVSMDINFGGTRSTLNLSKKMKNMQAFVYVSTAYVKTDHKEINEIVYDPPALYEDVYNVLKEHRDEVEKVYNVLNGHPNTYTFTKALAENYVAEHHEHIPTIIIRPSIVMGSKNEPVQGWIDNWFGANGTMTMVGRGFVRVICGKGSNFLDLIPVDYVSNLVVVAAAKCDRSSGVQVYNSSSSTANPVTIETVCRYFIAENVRQKSNIVPYPTICFTNYHWLIILITFLAQKVPAFIMDCFLFLTGKQPRYQKLQKKLQRLHKEQQYFTSNSWLIHSKQAHSLYASLSYLDKSIFPCDPSNITWPEYLTSCSNGINTYLS